MGLAQTFPNPVPLPLNVAKRGKEMIGIHFFGAYSVLFLVKTPFSIVREETCEELRILSLEEEGMQQYEVLFDVVDAAILMT